LSTEIKVKKYVGIGLLALVGLMIYGAQKGNLFNKPVPGESHTAVGELPSVSRALASAKSLAEENAKAAIDAPRRPLRRTINMSEGRRLYGEVKAQNEGLIGYLRSGLTTRFAGTEPRAIERELEAAQLKLAEFLSWSRRSLEGREGPIMAGAADNPLQIGLDVLTGWLASLRAADDEAVRQLSLQLLEYRMVSWDELTRETER